MKWTALVHLKVFDDIFFLRSGNGNSRHFILFCLKVLKGIGLTQGPKDLGLKRKLSWPSEKLQLILFELLRFYVNDFC
jgi:hypothetical protein